MSEQSQKRPASRSVAWSVAIFAVLQVFGWTKDLSIPLAFGNYHQGGIGIRIAKPTRVARCVVSEEKYDDSGKDFDTQNIDSVRSMILEVAPLYGMRQSFAAFADDLRPQQREFHIKDIQFVLVTYAREMWPNCSVCLQGSAERGVDNKHYSDVDFAISTQGNTLPSDQEIEHFCGRLKHHTYPNITIVRDTLGEKKAIELKMHNMNVDVAFKDLLGDASLHGPDVIANLTNLYREYPRAVLAARVAKYVFHAAGLKGLDVEFILNDLARKQVDLWENRLDDSQGLELFRKIVVEIFNYGCTTHGPMERLEIQARSQHGRAALQYVTSALEISKVIAECILLLKGSSKGKSKEESQCTMALLECNLQKYLLLVKDHAKHLEPAGESPQKVGGEARGDCTPGGIQKRGKTISSGQRDTKGEWKEFPQTMTERVLIIFDDVLYCLENGDMKTTRLEGKFFKGWCMGVDAFLEMATKTTKKRRWKKRSMPSSMDEVREKMLALDVHVADMRAFVESWNIPLMMKAPVLAFLSFWAEGWANARKQ